MSEKRQWQHWVLPEYAVVVFLALTVFPAWVTIPIAVGAAVLYLMFSPLRAVPPSPS